MIYSLNSYIYDMYYAIYTNRKIEKLVNQKFHESQHIRLRLTVSTVIKSNDLVFATKEGY